MPSTAAICSTASTASGDSIWAMPNTRSRAFSIASGSVPNRAPRWNSAIPRPRAVVHRARPRRRLLGGVDLRAHHALDAEVERAGGPAADVGLHAHERVHAACGRAEQLAEQQRLVAAAVLEVDEQPVEAGQGQRFGGQRAAERQERAEQGLARGQAGLHMRSSAHHVRGSPDVLACAIAGPCAAMRLTIPLLAAFAAVLLVPAAAQAGTLSYDGDTLYFQAAGGERNSPFLDKTDDGRLSIVETGLTIAAGCEQEFSWGPAYCPMPSRVVMTSGTATTATASPPTSRRSPSRSTAATARTSCRPTAPTNATARRRRRQRHPQGLADRRDAARRRPATTRSRAAAATTASRPATATTRSAPTRTTGPGNDYVDGGAGFDLIDDWSIPSDDYHPPVVADAWTASPTTAARARRTTSINVEKIESHVSGTLAGGDGDDELPRLREHRRGQLDAGSATAATTS